MPEISTLAGASRASPSATVVRRRDDPKRVADAARQFESLLIGQLLKSMRESGEGGWLGTGDDQAGAQAMELAEEQMAQALAQQGGFGIGASCGYRTEEGIESAGRCARDERPLARRTLRGVPLRSSSREARAPARRPAHSSRGASGAGEGAGDVGFGAGI